MLSMQCQLLDLQWYCSYMHQLSCQQLLDSDQQHLRSLRGGHVFERRWLLPVQFQLSYLRGFSLRLHQLHPAELPLEC